MAMAHTRPRSRSALAALVVVVALTEVGIGAGVVCVAGSGSCVQVLTLRDLLLGMAAAVGLLGVGIVLVLRATSPAQPDDDVAYRSG